MTRPATVTIVEVGPRDGLQNEGRIVPIEQRIAVIDALSRSGLPIVEAGSFVSPRAIPQMAGTGEVLRGISKTEATRYPVLVPNATGMRHAIDAGARDVAVFVSASESFSRRNINCSIAASLDHVAEVVALAGPQGIRVRGYISCVLGCPYEGDVAATTVAGIAGRLASLGCDEISLGDTIGIGTAQQAQDMVRAVVQTVPMARLAVHFHDTCGQALANVLACLEAGIAVIDSAAGGLGGCPYANGASGNLATEDLLYMLDGLGIASSVDIEALLDAVELIETSLGIAARSKLFAARRRQSARLGSGGMTRQQQGVAEAGRHARMN
ncbi:hydroxymethylglutaryl-CoA lyase [Sphingomonas sp. SRS2]|uniref:hydroxymethylglutaryl-CoA lyase n=1 Tax=Sphingomonas sp. SRS2 TaxID=133190 RepID=UPI0006183E9D|nr:hydroxymethylglutaryl-CoA lyase [Sphingomonas sp. SRS2]KKC23750.1 hydroxymethylglutaryl-CoA lyase [Sphingomonas sp. SRS2]